LECDGTPAGHWQITAAGGERSFDSSPLSPPTPEQQEATLRRHAVIAGTGRAGSNLLVRFLEHCGLDTGLQDVPVNPLARAGLEHSLLTSSTHAIPSG